MTEPLTVEQGAPSSAQLARVFARARREGREVRRFCWSCRRWLVHRAGSCARPSRVKRERRPACVCDVHTCYDAVTLGINDGPGDAEVYVD